jgi:DNA invertase Pin-like site-specific DNA recombinase
MSGTSVETKDAGPGSGELVGYARAAGGAGRAGGGPAARARALTALVRELTAAGCTRVGAEEEALGQAGGPSGRPGLAACLASLRGGDTLVVASLDQLGRSQRELIATVQDVRRRGAGLRSLREGLDTTAPGGEAIFRVFAGLAEFGRAAVAAGTSDGLAAARATGKRLGRPPALTPGQLREVRALLLRPEHTISSVARAVGVSRSTIYKYLPADERVPAAHLAPYQARPGRHVLVIDDLGDLRGPVSGTVELPLRLFWSLPDHRFDLDEPDLRRWYYETVLREATRPADLAAYLDGETLVSVWPELYLPKGVRRGWEERHPALRAPVSA